MKIPSHSRWLIVRQGALGDTILLSPLIQWIRQCVPLCKIDVMGFHERVALLVGEGLADAAHSIERPGMESLYADDPEIPPEWVSFFQSYDVILFFSNLDQEKIKKRLHLSSATLFRTHPAIPSPHTGTHCVNHYFHILDGILAWDTPPDPFLKVGEKDRSHAFRYLQSLGIDLESGRLLVLHPGAGSRTKLAPFELFLQIVHVLIPKTKTPCLLVQGPADHDVVNRFMKQWPPESPVHILKDLPLREIAAILSLADGMIGNDSGIAHLAAAVGCPTCVFFIDSDPAIWAPLGGHVRVLDFRNCCSDPDAVLQKVSLYQSTIFEIIKPAKTCM